MGKYKRMLESIQRVAVKFVPSLRQLLHEERLGKLKQATLEERREKGNLIMMFQSIKGLK